MAKSMTRKEELQLLKKLNPRVGFDGFLYYDICRGACAQVKKLKSEVVKVHALIRKGGQLCRLGKGMRLLDEIKKQESITIAFAAMCLEACIWDYAASKTSKNKAEQNFGSLNLVAKWVVIPQLFCGSDITKKRIDDTCLLDRLRKLVKERNNLMHSKSTALPDKLSDAKKAMIPKPRQITAKEAFSIIRPLLEELKKVDKAQWWLFKDFRYQRIIS